MNFHLTKEVVEAIGNISEEQYSTLKKIVERKNEAEKRKQMVMVSLIEYENRVVLNKGMATEKEL